MPVTRTRSTIGEFEGNPVDRFEISNGVMRAAFISFGAIIQEIWVPDRNGHLANVNLGFASLDPYLRKHPHFGAVLGRFANRMSPPRFELDGVTWPVTDNRDGVSAHGGDKPFDAYLWSAEESEMNGEPAVTFTHVSPDGDEGYPGELTVALTYSLDDAHGLRLNYVISTSKATIANITNHAYFNLAGEGSGTIDAQELQLHCTHFTPTDERQVTTGELREVAGTAFDFRSRKPLGAVLRDGSEPQLRIARGLDHNFVVDRTSEGELVRVGTLTDPASGRVMHIETTEPGVQVYASNSLDGSLVGYSGAMYRQGDAVCFETQQLPNAPHHANFPSSVVRPDAPRHSTTIYRFEVAK